MRRLGLLLLLLPAFACAAPDRAGLVQAWETAMRRDGTLEAQPDGGYRYRNEAIGYDGGVKVTSAIVRTGETEGLGEDDLEAMGTVDFDLDDLPESSKGSLSTGLMIWKVERQNFFYDAAKQAWLTSAEWAKAHYHGESDGMARNPVSRWVMDYAIPLGLVGLLVAVFWWLSRAQRQAKSQMADALDVNRLARDNVERAAQLQEQQRVSTEEALELARRNAAALESILAELRRRPV